MTELPARYLSRISREIATQCIFAASCAGKRMWKEEAASGRSLHGPDNAHRTSFLTLEIHECLGFVYCGGTEAAFGGRPDCRTGLLSWGFADRDHRSIRR